MTTRNPYPSDVSDDEWAFVAPYSTLVPSDAGQRHYELREVYNGLRWMVPHDLPLWYIVYQQTQRWLAAGCFEAMVHDLRLLLRGIKGRKAADMPVTMERSDGKGAKYMSPLIPLGIC